MRLFLRKSALFAVVLFLIFGTFGVLPWAADAGAAKKKKPEPVVKTEKAVVLSAKTFEDAVRMVRGSSAEDPFSFLLSASNLGYALNRVAGAAEPFIRAMSSVNPDVNSVLPGLEMVKRIAVTEFVALIGIAEDGTPYLRVAAKLPDAAKGPAAEFESSLGKKGGAQLFEALLGPAGLVAGALLSETETVSLNETTDALRIGGADGPVAFVSGAFLFAASDAEQMRQILTGKKGEKETTGDCVVFTVNPEKAKNAVKRVKEYDTDFASFLDETLKLMNGRFIMKCELSDDESNGEKSKLLTLRSNLSEIAVGVLKDSIRDISDGKISDAGKETIVRASGPVFDMAFGLGGFKDIVRDYMNDLLTAFAPYGVGRGLLEGLLERHALGLSIGYSDAPSKGLPNVCLSLKGPADEKTLEKLFNTLMSNEKFLNENSWKAKENGHYGISSDGEPFAVDFGMTEDKRGLAVCLDAKERLEKWKESTLAVDGSYFLWLAMDFKRIMEMTKALLSAGNPMLGAMGGMIPYEIVKALDIEPDVRRIEITQKDVDGISVRFILR